MSPAATATTTSTRDPTSGSSPHSPPEDIYSAREGQRGFASELYLSREQMLGAPVRWPRPSRLEDRLDVPQEGKLAEGLRALGLTSVGALLEHLPRDSREARTVAALKAGEQATVAVQ